MNTIIIRTEATDKTAGMTLAELEEFVRDAREHNLPGDTPIRVSTGFRAQIHWVQVPR